MRIMNRAVRFFATVLVQLLYSVGLFTIAAAVSGLGVTVFLVVAQCIRGAVTLPIWRIWLFSAVPVWVLLEVYVNVRVWKILHEDKKRRKLRERGL